MVEAVQDRIVDSWDRVRQERCRLGHMTWGGSVVRRVDRRVTHGFGSVANQCVASDADEIDEPR